MTLNPACTPGWVWRTSLTTVTAYCGCGWTMDGLPSKTAAKAAQREHRFPPLCDRCGGHLEDDVCQGCSCSCGRDDRTDPHEFGRGCDSFDPDYDCHGCDDDGQLVTGCPVHDEDQYAGWVGADVARGKDGRYRPVKTVDVVPDYAV